ncbi:MAG TPA: flavin reductase family protein [Dokdonella sp.]|nr:flavin reductase family protein [Dokdonella sp.]
MAVSPTPALDSRMFRNVMGRFPTGVAVVTFLREGEPAGITVNSFLPVSMDPPLVLVSLRRESSAIHHLDVGDRYAVNVLSEAQQSLGAHFAGSPVAGLTVAFSRQQDVPLIPGSLAHIVARVVDVHEAGDHFLYIAAVEYLWQGNEAQPLIFYSGRYKQLHAHDPSTHFDDVLESW